MDEQKKTTTLYASVGADAGQPFVKDNTEIVSNSIEENNPSQEEMYALLRKMNQFNDPHYLHTISLNELFESVYEGRTPIVDGLLSAGIFILAGAPKTGKSFLVAQIAYHVSTGQSLWGYAVRQGTVLYLALEDDYRRLQGRMYRMFGTESNEQLHFAIYAKQLGSGLDEQLKQFVQEHRNTKLIIIDTLQKVREAQGETYSYAGDYELIGKLKRFADENVVCVLVVHHTRKQQADDKFDRISGTNGLLGAADGALILEKEKRTSNTATLDISSRDEQDQRLYLTRDEERLIWNLERTETELWKEPPDPILESVASILTKENPMWSGSPTELAERLNIDLKPNVLTMRLNVKAGKLLQDYEIHYENTRTHAGRKITLARKTE